MFTNSALHISKPFLMAKFLLGIEDIIRTSNVKNYYISAWYF